jgi:hypothetical protein
MSEKTFYDGIVCTLAALNAHHLDSVYDDVLASCGDIDEIIKSAKKAGAMRWSGLDRYVREQKRKARE